MKKLNFSLFEKNLLKEEVQLKAIIGGYTGNSYTVTGTNTTAGRTLEDRQYDTQTVCNVIVDSVS